MFRFLDSVHGPFAVLRPTPCVVRLEPAGAYCGGDAAGWQIGGTSLESQKRTPGFVFAGCPDKGD